MLLSQKKKFEHRKSKFHGLAKLPLAYPDIALMVINTVHLALLFSL